MPINVHKSMTTINCFPPLEEWLSDVNAPQRLISLVEDEEL